MTKTSASKAQKAVHVAKTKATQAAKAAKAAQAAKAKADQAKAKADQAKAKAKAAQAKEKAKVDEAKAKKARADEAAKAASASSGDFAPFTITYSARTVLVPRPKTYKAAVNLVYKNFESLRGYQLCFQTTQVRISHGCPVELTADSWKGIVDSITAVEVVIGERDY